MGFISKLFKSLRHDFYSHFMAKDVFDTVRNCQACAKARDKRKKPDHHPSEANVAQFPFKVTGNEFYPNV